MMGVPADVVVRVMRETDSTDDREFMAELEREIRKYPTWVLTRIDPRKSLNVADDRTVREYAENAAEEFPPIIAVPEDGGFWPLDGSHRVAAAIIRRDAAIEAWIPEGSKLGGWNPPWRRKNGA